MDRFACRLRTNLVGGLLFVLTPHTIAQTAPVAINDWARKTIELPPAFAPDMPAGVEELRFPPGWRDPASDNFWSYAIVLQIEEPVPTTTRLEQITEFYYRGLMSAFGVGHTTESPPNEVEVDLEETTSHEYRGTMRLVDGFATFKPIVVNLKARSLATTDSSSTIEFRASVQSHDHAIWSDLQAAIEHILAEQPNQHLAHLARLTRGEWRTTPANGTQQRDVWTWGPSKHALTSITSNSQATSQAIFGSFRVIYFHPQRNELTVLALSAPHLIQSGTITQLEGLDLRFDMTLYYDLEHFSWATEPTRKISSVWAFGTPTSYINHWIEDQGQPVDPSMTGWSYARHDDVTPLPPTATEPPEHIKHLSAFVPLLQSEWSTDTTRTSFAWIPYNEAILMRTVDTRTNKQVSEAIFYPHPHTKVIQTLTIHDSGEIDEGIAKSDGDAILILAERAGDTTTTHIEQRIEQLNAGTLRTQTWSIDGTHRTLLIETTHQASND